jgi:SynChlorMet cassette radical SAM/SPASM protein ScmF
MVKKMADRKLELPDGIPPLVQYYVYLTGGCNLACQHCWITPTFQTKGGTGGHLDYDLFALAIEEGLPLGLSGVKLTGGEPLLHPDFLRIVDLLREKGLGLVIETNGTLLTESLAHYLRKKSTLNHISVSLDGASADTHDPFRGVRGSFKKAVQGIRYLVENGFRPQVIMSIHSGNVGEIEALVRLAESLGARSVKFNLIQPVGRGETMTKRNQLLDIQCLIERGNWVENDLQKRTSIELLYSWPMAYYNLHRLLTRGVDACGIFNILGILASGHLAMCGIGVEIPELVYGKLGKDRLEHVWFENETLQALRRDLPDNLEGVCGSCILKQKCLGSCVANNYHQSGRLTDAFWFCQQAAEHRLFPETRRLSSQISVPID